MGEVAWKIVGDAYMLLKRCEGEDFDYQEQNEMGPLEMATYLMKKKEEESYQNGSVSGKNLHDWEMWCQLAMREEKSQYKEAAKVEKELLREMKAVTGTGILTWIERYLEEYTGETQRRRTILLGDSSGTGQGLSPNKHWNRLAQNMRDDFGFYESEKENTSGPLMNGRA